MRTSLNALEKNKNKHTLPGHLEDNSKYTQYAEYCSIISMYTSNIKSKSTQNGLLSSVITLLDITDELTCRQPLML